MKIRMLLLLIIWLVSFFPCLSQILSAPVRSDKFPSGSQFAKIVSDIDPAPREDSIYAHIIKGNIPGFIRKMVAVNVADTVYKEAYLLTYYVLPDYLSIGSDTDFLRIPMTPMLAQKIATLFNCSLPTTKMVDDIHRFSQVKLYPYPMTPDETMTTVPVFMEHNKIINQQRDSLISKYPVGTLMAGHKKDVVITNRLLGEDSKEKVAIYGWHYPWHRAIQHLYTRHTNRWVDYSHGIRLISNNVILNGKSMQLSEIFQDPIYSKIISKEGVVSFTKYPVEVPTEFEE